MKLSRLAALAGILVWVAAGCVGNVTGADPSGGGGNPGGSCSSGLTMCGGGCVNTSSNAANCGGCGKACAGGQVCDNGQCTSSCSAGAMLCGNSCANVSTDAAHCGNCTTMCRSDQTCSGGNCVCPAGTTLCSSGVCAANCGGGTGSGGTTGGSGGVSGSGGATLLACNTPAPGRAPLRRLTTFEYNNTLRDLLGDTTNPGNALPSEASGNGFGNNADEQSVSAFLAEGYGTVATDIAARATASATALGKLAPCGSNVTTATEESCATTIINTLLPKAYRRTVTAAEQTEYLNLYKSLRGLSTTMTFAQGVAGVIEAILQAPDFLYRVEFGTPDPANPAVKKLTGREVATRLSYFLWQTMPDSTLTAAADANMLSTPAQVKTQAQRLLDDPKSHPTVAFYFDNVLPLPILTDLARDKVQFPTFSATIGQQMRQETQRTIEHEIFENTTQASGSPYMPGTLPALLTTPYTWVNQALYNFYGASSFSGPAVTGTAFQKVNLNTTQRLGILTQASVMAGTTTTNLTNPVLRGTFVINKIMCRDLHLPTDPATLAAATVPVPYTGWTSRERYTAHASQPVCKACHQFLDPIGLALENYDAVGLYRTTERATINGETRDTPIDASGSVPGVPGTANGGVELVKLLASSEEINTCFASHWIEFAYGRQMETADGCNKQAVQLAFKNSGYNIKQMLLAITQTDGFLMRPAQ